MNEEQKRREMQIEEMAKVMPEKIKDPLDNSRYIIFGKSLRREIARIYYNAGYRKIDKDNIVLSREEPQALKKQIEYWEYETKVAREEIDNAGKETAKEIIDMLIPNCEVCDENWHKGCLCLRATIAEKIAKQYGVEVEE